MANKTLEIQNEITPLQKKLETIANQIGLLGGYVAILTFIALCIRLAVVLYLDGATEYFTFENGMKLLSFFIIAVTVIVVAVPEGLPLAVTISLAFSVSKMFKEDNLVRKLHASETMGNANEICSDKTGTLTQNKMTVQALYMSDKISNGDMDITLGQNPNILLLAQSVVYNCSAFVETEDSGKKAVKGNVTEVGMLKYLLDSKVDIETLIAHKTEEHFFEFEIPFTSLRKRQTTAVKLPNGDVRVFSKGGPEIVMPYCTKMLNADGFEVEMTEEKKRDILEVSVVKPFCDKTYRTILVAYADHTAQAWAELKTQNNGFTNESDKETTE